MMKDFFTDATIANLYQKAPCGFLITTLDGVICRGNRTFLSWTEMNDLDVIGKNVRELLSPASKLLYETHYTALLEADRVSGVAMELIRSTTSALPVLVTSRIEQDSLSSSRYIHSTFFDASDRRDSERALVTAKRRADTLADVVHSSPHAILTADYELRVRTWNVAAQALLGEEGQLGAGASLSCFLPERTLESLVGCLEREQAVTENVTLSLGVVCRMSAYPMTDGLAIYLADVTKEVETQGALNAAHDRFTLATMATSDGIWDWNCETGIVYLSGRAQAMLGHPLTAVELPLPKVLRRFHARDLALLRASTLVENAAESRIETEWRVRHRDGSWRWLHSRGMVLYGPTQSPLRMVGSLTDVTGTRTEDPLTGLHTRLSLLDRLEWRLSTEDRFERPCAVLFTDIDGFKKVNDGLGHAAGDTLIVEIAARLQAALLGQPGALAARLGGDEFVLLLEEVSGPEEACTFAAELQQSIQSTIYVGGQQLSISISVGIALSRPFVGRPEDLLHNADSAMYRAKAAGKGKHILFSEEMHHAAHKRLTLEADLSQAVRDGALQLFYQPKVSLEHGLTTGYEALGRWRHPIHGMVSPELFIAIAEDSNLIRDIGRWTIHEAIRQIAHWQQEKVVSSSTTVSINLSPKQFEDSELIAVLSATLKQYGVSPACIHFEVTEGVLIGNVDAALSVLTRLKTIGVGLELDDFGKGYSSLGYLHRYPFDVLKIDRSFVSGLGEQEDSDAIVQTIITLAHKLNLEVVAEGIETTQQQRILRALGCDIGQGYLFSKPVPPETIVQMAQAIREDAKENTSSQWNIFPRRNLRSA